jgi:transcriptional regulator with XRE-family HTH domain/quercetin dioxygenase-like cupin family protein
MSQPEVPRIGERIRAERLRRGMSLRALARAVGVSASLVSQIETGKSQPSVSTLYAITTALGVPVEDVFDAAEATDVRAAAPATVGSAGPRTAAVAGAGGLLTATAAALGGGVRTGPVVRKSERDVLELDSGVTWERLGKVPGTHVDFLLITYQPGSSSSSSGQLMRHPGTEYGYVTAGELTLTLGFDEYRLGPGDSTSFPSSTPHRYRNDGTEQAVGVWFVLEQP